MVMYDNEYKTMENKSWTKDKIKPPNIPEPDNFCIQEPDNVCISEP